MKDKKTKQQNSKLKSRIIFFIGYVALFILANILTNGRFFTKTNLISTVSHAVYPGLAGFGMVFIMTGGIIDLSVGATVILAGNVGAYLACYAGMGYAGLIIGCLVCAAACEVFTVFLGLKLKIPSWIAGLGMTLIYESIMGMYTSYLSTSQMIIAPGIIPNSRKESI